MKSTLENVIVDSVSCKVVLFILVIELKLRKSRNITLTVTVTLSSIFQPLPRVIKVECIVVEFIREGAGVIKLFQKDENAVHVYLLVCHVTFLAKDAGFLLHRARNHMTDQQIYFSG